MTISNLVKDITPSYEWIGKHQRIRGYLARLIDTDTLICSRILSTHHEAEVWLDERAYELLQQPSTPDACPSCGDPLQDGERLCKACVESGYALMPEGDVLDTDGMRVSAPIPLATDMYNVVCLVLSGAAATTAISELRRVQARYEKEMRK